MRMYALYERSRVVLALYIAVSVIAVVIGCVSLSVMTLMFDADLEITTLISLSGPFSAEGRAKRRKY